ncbi:3-oxoacyl-ACP reductase FabG [Patescibacteria group bacterium]|nr:MAG: 3-oxoacyl-ACP reductase FabG [Patescibacteria group bacterium]
MSFGNKIVIVTGSSRGIGKATALTFARLGADVVVNCSKSIQEAELVVEEIRGIGQGAIVVRADVSRETDVIEMIDKTLTHFGRIDVLVNNAGIVDDKPFMDKTSDDWLKILKTNLIGSFLCAKHSYAHLKKNSGSSIVNVVSSNGIDSFCPDSVDYDASKAGLISLTRNMAAEFAPEVRVNAVAPGWVMTEMNKDLPKDFVESELKRIYQNRFAEPGEIANVIGFLASESASFMTGSIVKVDGGYGAKGS